MAILLKQVKKSRAERETDEQGGQTARQMERRAGRETTRKFRLGGPKGGRGISGRFPHPPPDGTVTTFLLSCHVRMERESTYPMARISL